MRLESLYINGFGLFHDLKIEGLSSGLTLFLGDNESGKSTLLGFIRAILFGFPDRRSNENLYPPLAGGRHGGNISFSIDGNQSYVVERYPGARGGKVDVLKPDQTHGSKEFLNSLLGIGNRTLFNNIYAFSLSELQDFETLNTESVREALYSAGAGIDPGGLTNIKSGLEKKEGELFKQRSNKPKINIILSRLTNILKEKKTLLGSVDDYDRIKSQISQLEKDIDTYEKKKSNLTIQLKKNDQWINIRPEWINLSLARRKLEDLDPVESFPSQGLARLEGLNTRLNDLKNELIQKEEELKRRESELRVLTPDPEILNQSSSIRQLQRDQGHFEAVVRELLSIKQDISANEQRLRESLHRLGVSWTEKMVMEFDLSIATREEVRNYRESLSRAGLEEQRRRDSLEVVLSGKREAEGLLQDLNEPSEKDAEQLRSMKKACQKLRSLESRDLLLKEELRHKKERLNDLKEEKELLEETMIPDAYLWPFWPIPAIISAGVLILIWFGSRNDWRWAFSGMALFLLAGLALGLLRSKIRNIEEERGPGARRRSQLLILKIDDLEEKIADLKTRLDLIREYMDSASSVLSLSEVPSGESLERMEQEISERITRLDRWKDAEKDLAQIEKRDEEARTGLQHAASESNRIRGDWQEWLKGRGLDPVLSPDGVLETLTLIQSCKEQIEGLGQLRSRVESLEEIRETYLSLANKVLTSCNRKPAGDGEVQVAVHNLIQDLSYSEQADQKKELLTREIEASRESAERLNRRTRGLQKEIRDLLVSGGTDNEEEFRKRALVFEKRTALNKEIESCRDSISRLSHNLGEQAKVMEELSKSNLEGLEKEKLRLEKDLKEIETELDRLKKEQARLEEQTRQLVNDERISALRTEEEGLKEELSLYADEWIVVKLAQSLIRMARTRYEKERQPEVISEAGRFFNQLTLGKYPSLVAPIGESRIEVVSQDNSRKEIGQLSRGTAEQLYLSLRFGFIREFSKRSNPLPIIMDEILVNFDLSRAKATVKGICELSREHQVLFFTCHPEIAALFREADFKIPVLKISGGEVKG